jgi:nitroreductase
MKENIPDLYGEIFRRKSIRKFDPKEPEPALLEKLIAAADKAVPLIEEPFAFRVLTREQVEKPFGKAPCYLAVYAKKEADAMISAAFLLQQMSLWLSSQGIGSCWVGMGKPKPELVLVEGLSFISLIAFGYPDEDLYRKETKEFKRKPLSEITDLKGLEKTLEPVRLAPSAMNRQGWHLSGGTDKIHLYMADGLFIMKKIMEPLGLADAGIALCHLWLAAEHDGSFGSFAKENGDLPVIKKYHYVWTVNLK